MPLRLPIAGAAKGLMRGRQRSTGSSGGGADGSGSGAAWAAATFLRASGLSRGTASSSSAATASEASQARAPEVRPSTPPPSSSGSEGRAADELEGSAFAAEGPAEVQLLMMPRISEGEAPWQGRLRPSAGEEGSAGEEAV